MKTLSRRYRDRALASVCANCPACRQARRRQSGLAFRVVKRVESGVCPFCRAYKRVTGHPPYEAH